MKTLFIDVDTQFDFMYPAGALYVRQAERLIPTIAELNRYAAARAILVISTVDAHAENDAEFTKWPPHCIAGTLGQQKAAATLLDKRTVVPTRPGEYALNGAQQVILEKQALDLFTNPNLTAILTSVKPDRCIVYGVVTEYCVRCAAMGLLRFPGRVELVTDAIQTLKEEDGRRTVDEFVAAGGQLTTAAACLQSA